MATNGVNSVDEADITECDGEKVVTMMDVLQEQQEFEEDANAVLGASDDKECTYSKGYIKRQAIYACLTCCSEAKDNPTQRAGVCLACSLNCHENHELIELYTKRNFKCDCGNPKFNSHPCQFTPNKTELNEDNNYNQNFSGIYCICNRPYPDPEATVEEEMIQCIICEDWLHSNHLDAAVPANDLYAEMICKACMDTNGFLHDYSQLAVNYEVDVDVTTVNGVDNLKNGNNTDNTQLVNGKIDTSDITCVNIENEKEETEMNGNSSNNEDAKTIEKDAEKTNDETESSKEITSMDCTPDNFKELQSEEKASIPIDHNDAENSNIIEPEKNTKQDESGLLDTKDIGNETDLNTSKFTSQMDTEDAKQKIDDDNEESTKLSCEQNESITESTEQVSKQSVNLKEQDNSNSIEDNITGHTNHEENQVSKDNNSNIGVKENTLSSAIDDENHDPIEGSKPSEVAHNASKEVPDNFDTEACPKQANDCEIDSLEAATNELSKLMTDEGETSNELEGNKAHEVQKHTESTTNGNSSKDEDMNGDTIKNTAENNISIPTSTENDHKRKLDDPPEEVSVKKQKLDKNENCLRPRGVKKAIKGAAFWPSNFRQKLCTCNECLSMYKDLSVLFLIDPEDTVTAYETLGKERTDGAPASQYEKGLQALSSLDRVQQINALTEYNKMRDKLLDFLKSFKDRKEVVKEEDIKAFFAGMKPRREPDGVYFCR